MPGLFLAGFGVDDEDAVLVEDQQVRLAGEDGRVATELKGVLVLDAYVVAALDLPVSVFVQERGMAGKPVGLVAVGGLAIPSLVASFEPDGPFAGSFSGEQAGEPCGPDVGELALCSRHDVDSRCWSWGIVTSLSVIGRRPLWADVISVVGARAVGGCQSGIRGLLMVAQRPLRIHFILAYQSLLRFR